MSLQIIPYMPPPKITVPTEEFQPFFEESILQDVVDKLKQFIEEYGSTYPNITWRACHLLKDEPRLVVTAIGFNPDLSKYTVHAWFYRKNSLVNTISFEDVDGAAITVSEPYYIYIATDITRKYDGDGTLVEETSGAGYYGITISQTLLTPIVYKLTQGEVICSDSTCSMNLGNKKYSVYIWCIDSSCTVYLKRDDVQIRDDLSYTNIGDKRQPLILWVDDKVIFPLTGGGYFIIPDETEVSSPPVITTDKYTVSTLTIGAVSTILLESSKVKTTINTIYDTNNKIGRQEIIWRNGYKNLLYIDFIHDKIYLRNYLVDTVVSGPWTLQWGLRPDIQILYKEL